MRFEELNLAAPLMRALTEAGYLEPTPIQEQAIAPLLAGRDMLACAQTGTGKTAAFALPILQALDGRNRQRDPRGLRPIKVLILAPTRELALQIDESFATYGKHTSVRSTVIFGGVGQNPQVQALRRGVDILVATPGRLLDLQQQRLLHLDQVDTLVLDEADRMLDMGFVRDVQRIVATLPKNRQTMLFSATLAPEVVRLAGGILRDPVHISVTPTATTVERIAQQLYFVGKQDKRDLLNHLLRDPAIERTIVFTRTKHGADKVVRNLADNGVRALAIHGNKSQPQRVRALETFRSGETRVLVATDIAARGIDVDGITHVFNYELPEVPESYVHRIGRTARAGADGIAVAFCAPEERESLRDIERLIRQPVPVVTDHPFVNSQNASPAPFQRGAQGERPQSRRPQSHPSQGRRHQPSRQQAWPQRDEQSAGAQGRPQQPREPSRATRPSHAPNDRPTRSWW